VTLPKANAPVPARRPTAKPGPETTSKPVRARTQTRKARRSVSSRAAGSTAHASLSAGERNAYFRRLLGHVQRYKTYPEAAERAGITGATLVSITIDRSGKLVRARVLRGSGHALLDKEALSVARRAAPFPAPPDGIGSSTFSFSVTLRFRRGL
jgi:protein TonB